MARREATRRYDAKLDAFLHLHLPRADYARVCTSEPCVATYPEEKRVHRHVVLGHRRLYLVDVPPRSLKATLALSDVESVEMRDDLPDFLSGKEREHTTHVQIRYRRRARENSRGLISSISAKSPAVLKKALSRKGSKLNPALSSRAGPSQTLLQSGDSSVAQSAQSSAASSEFVRSVSTQSFSPFTSKRNLPQHRSRSLGQTVSEEFDSQLALPTDAHTHRSPPLPLATSPPFEIGAPDFHESLYSTLSSPALPRSRESSSSALYRKRLPPGSNSLQVTHSARGSMQSLANGRLSISSSNIGTPSLRSEQSFACSGGVARRKASSQSLFNLQRASSPSLYSSAPSLNSLSIASHLAAASSPSLSASTDQLETPSDSGPKMEKVVMDLYVLNDSTDFYHQFCAVWADLRIRQVLEQGVDISEPKKSRDGFAQQYSTLKEELVSAPNMEVSAALVQELATAAQRYLVIRRIFWEDCELVDYCVRQLQHHLPAEGMAVGCSKEDQIEFLIILLELLYQMLRETHPFPKRMVLLTRDSGKLLLSLARLIIAIPPLTMHTDPGEPEMANLQEELSEKACGVLFELIRVAQQAKWPLSTIHSNVSVGWLVEAVSSLATINDFCEHVVVYAKNTISGHALVTPQQQVTLHHAATILDVFTRNSTAIARLLHKHFMEEFRYFISVTRAKQRLPQPSSLSSATLEMLQTAKLRVLQG